MAKSQCSVDQSKGAKMKKHKPIDPMAFDLSEMFMVAVTKHLTTTAFCLDLARTALGWELAGNQKEARKAIRKMFDQRNIK